MVTLTPPLSLRGYNILFVTTPVPVYAFLKCFLAFYHPGHSGPPALFSPYLLSLSPNPPPKLPWFYFPIILHVNIPTILPFKHTLLLNYIFPFHAPSLSIFAIFGTTYGCPLLLAPPHLYTLYFIVFPYSPPPEWPILLSCPCLPAILPTHFEFSNPFLDTFCIYFNYYICIHVHM